MNINLESSYEHYLLWKWASVLWGSGGVQLETQESGTI